MPTYLIHGFRWHREAIRIHIIMNNLDDAAAEWIIAPATSTTLLNSFYESFDFLPPSNPPQAEYNIPVPPIPTDDEDVKSPKTLRKSSRKVSMNGLRSLGRKSRPPNLATSRAPEDGMRDPEIQRTPRTPHTHSTTASRSSLQAQKEKAPPLAFNDWSAVKLMEQYDPDDTQVVSQPYAYVADYMVQVTLSANLQVEMAQYTERSREAEWPLSSGTPSPQLSESSSQASDGVVGGVGMSARELRRKTRRVGWLEKLRDGLQKDEEIGWFVVYCGDEERVAPEMMELQQVDSRDTGGYDGSPQRTPRSAGLRAFFRGRSNTGEKADMESF